MGPLRLTNPDPGPEDRDRVSYIEGLIINWKKRGLQAHNRGKEVKQGVQWPPQSTEENEPAHL